jgi:Alpha/beta hydrolase domain
MALIHLMPVARTWSGIALIGGLVACGANSNDGAASTPVAAAPVQGITRIVIDTAKSETVAFGGATFGAVGTYQKIRGVAHGQLDPNDPKNALITDIALAERNTTTGLVEYSADFYILAPTDLSKGNKKVFYEAPNRGSKTFGGFNAAGGGNDPGVNGAADATVAGAAYPAFLMNRGYTLIWSGWDQEPFGAATNVVRLNGPIAKNANGSTITGPSYEYIVSDNATTTSFTTYYNTNSTDTSLARMTKRQFQTDTPVAMAATEWQWTSPNTVALAGNAPFQRSWIYELSFTAKDPYIAGLGMAAVRDVLSFFRNASADTTGRANPLAGNVTRMASWTLSQPSRLMNDYIWLGFNQDLAGRKVLDGVFNWIGGGNGLGINYRFAQVGRTERNRQNHLAQLEGVFPFSYTTTTDGLTGKTDGRNQRCSASNTCPMVMNLYSSNELWVKAGSTLTTHPNTGLDVPEPSNVRNYLVSSGPHGGGATTTTAPSTCLQFGSQVEANPLMRALWVALDEWIAGTALPPPSANPSINDGTAVFASLGAHSTIGIGSVSQAAIGYPVLPASLNLYSGLVTVRNYMNFGPDFAKGIASLVPGLPTNGYYPNSVPKVDAIGNELPGIRLPEVVVPIATNSGWALRAPGFGGKADGTDGCEAAGQSVPLAKTAATKLPGDPRPALAELYVDAADLYAKRRTAAEALAARRLLLPNDVAAYGTARTITVVANPNYPSAYVYSYP